MLPNIYKGDYKLLAIAPLILMAIALFFIPSIKMGVDFQGGTLVTLSLSQSVDADALQAQLLDEGLDAKVQVFETSIGYRAEIEVPQSESLVRAEELKGEFNLLLPEVSALEVAAYQNSTYQDEYDQKRTELEAIANELFDIAGTSKPYRIK